jgi:hypothetical protein
MNGTTFNVYIWRGKIARKLQSTFATSAPAAILAVMKSKNVAPRDQKRLFARRADNDEYAK